MVRVEIKGLVVNVSTLSPVVVLRSEDGSVLPIVIGFFEAQAILLGLEKASLPRPLTHDLMLNLLKELGGKLLRLEIHSLKEGVYYAHLVVQIHDQVQTIDCRPSDGLALALRSQSPIFASEELLEKADTIKEYEGKKFIKSNQLDQPIDAREAEEFRKVIEGLSARDFWKQLRKETESESEET
ncbi:MAG: bifunctional nuclease family protein [Candidatus Omnitrophica bacterium]|nr:bifunctional nuclease family protein [Candidatus Omnitrophota bacterium]